MGKAIQYNRLLFLAAGLIVALSLLVIPLIELQYVRHDEWRDHAQDNTRRSVVRRPLRGEIRDVHGTPLAVSVITKTIWADPKWIGERAPYVARALAPILQTNEAWLVQQLRPHVTGFDTNQLPIIDRYVVLRQRAPIPVWNDVAAAMEKIKFEFDDTVKLRDVLKTNRAKFSKDKRDVQNLRLLAVQATDEQVRTYPNDSLAAQVIGYTTWDPVTRLTSGMIGLEQRYQTNLAGVAGWLRSEKDRYNHEIAAYRSQDVEPRDGLNLVTSLDARIQFFVETELAEAYRQCNPSNISCIVLRPRTGEIVAMASLPTFDPNRYGNPNASFRNRTISDQYEPGSTFKIVVVSAGLQEGVLTLTDRFNCESPFVYAKVPLHDHGKSYGSLSVEEIITKSSNIGAAKIGIQLGERRLYEYIQRFGFGARTGIELPLEFGGTVHPLDKWSGVSIAQIPMGQGVGVTPLQMVMAMGAIANRGQLMRPMLVQRLEDPAGQTVYSASPVPVRQVIGPAAVHDMVEALKTVVSKDGTAPKARLDNYTVAGKTGTAQKLDPPPKAGPGQKPVPGHYSTTHYVASFIGFFPADQPELCIGVFVDDPRTGEHLGGAIAAPVFRAIADRAARYLNIRPDITPETPGGPTLVVTRPSPGLTPLHPERD